MQKSSRMIPKITSDTLLVILIGMLCAALWFMPSGYEKVSLLDTQRAKALVTSVDNSDIFQYGIVKHGTQELQLEILNGKFTGKQVIGYNQLIGKMEIDKVFSEGDNALIVVQANHNNIQSVSVVDHYRINTELLLCTLFFFLLLIYGGRTGAKALLSFVFTGLLIWKILLPGFLQGYDPVILSLFIVSILTAVIIFLVAGIEKKGIVAFLGSMGGILLTCVLAVVFGHSFNIHGAIKPWSETLLYSGFPHLNLSKILFSAVFISASGAVMDIAMDVSASMNEVIQNKPDISLTKAIATGFSVGRAVLGTMTTTLLLAYSGGYTAMLIVFIAQGTPFVNVLNTNYVAAELLQTIVGSFGLVIVAPLTAIIGAFIYTSSGVDKKA